jgi:riboflavin kinase/FMN adenylyltransferase
VEEIPAQEVDHVKVSSTKVRQALTEGQVTLGERTTRLPVCRFRCGGERGPDWGARSGYPTANIGGIDPLKLIPGDGVYAVDVELRTGAHQGMLYIGERPTLGGTAPQRKVEVHVFDLDRDLYGETITVRLLERVRGDMRFADLDALKQQLQRDEADVRHRVKKIR